MVKAVTSVTVFPDATGMRMSATYSELDDTGVVISDNNRFDRVILDAGAKKAANTLLSFAQTFLDEKGE